jgi:hypothetical protein
MSRTVLEAGMSLARSRRVLATVDDNTVDDNEEERGDQAREVLLPEFADEGGHRESAQSATLRA